MYIIICNKLGIFFGVMNKAQVVNTTASSNTLAGIQLVGIVNSNISNTTISHKVVYGLDIFLSSSIHIDGNTATSNALQSHSRDNSGGILNFIDDEYNIVINNTTQ